MQQVFRNMQDEVLQRENWLEKWLTVHVGNQQAMDKPRYCNENVGITSKLQTAKALANSTVHLYAACS